MTAAKLFATGDYANAARLGDPDEWQTYAALGLVGKAQGAVEGLSRFDHQEARFYSAVASWIDGDEDRAARLLEEIRTPHAQNLLALIRKPQIQVLAQLPWSRRPPHDLLTAAVHDRKFSVQNISFHPHDLPNEPYADVHNYYDPQTPPDFFICAMVEWHAIPPNLQELPCPIIGHTSDYDVHIQTVHPWYQVFDELLTPGSTEWRDVRRLARVPVSTFPKSFGISDTLPPVPSGPRQMDTFLSGTVLHPYHPDKAQCFHEVLHLPDVNIGFINGFVLPEIYHKLLGGTKVSFSYVRFSGVSSRALEALSMGCAVVVQHDSVLPLYVGEEEGVLTYQPGAGNLARAMRQVFDRWPEFEPRARRGAAVIRREFALPRVASQYLRFLTFLAARPRGPRRRVPVERLTQKRSILWRGWFHGPVVNRKLLEHNIERWRAVQATATDPQPVIDMARELVLEYATTAFAPAARETWSTPADRRLLTQALSLYRSGLARFPRSLVLRFNSIRTALHFGRPQEVSDALQLTEETLSLPPSSWQIDVRDDVFPWDFFSSFFNYRKYFDLIIAHSEQSHAIQAELASLILASLNYYLSHYSENLEHAKQALTLDPDFPFYKLQFARQAIRNADLRASPDMEALLIDLAENSLLFVEALQLLDELQSRNPSADSRIAQIRQAVAKAESSAAISQGLGVFGAEQDWRHVTLQPSASLSSKKDVVDHAPAAVGGNTLAQSRAAHQGEPKHLVSALVPTYNHARFMRGLLEDLEAQTISDQMEIIIVDTDSPTNEGEIVAEFQKRYDNIVYVRTSKRENSHEAFNRCIKLAQGKYVTMANTDDRHKPDAYERMVAVLEARPDVALVYHNSYITATENETFENHTPVGQYRWIDFDPLQLLHGCFVGPQPMWRRSLHSQYGYIDESLAKAGDWDFWLRMAEHETFLHIDEFLGLYLYSPTSSEHADPELSQREAQIAQQRYLYREDELRERQARVELNAPAASGVLVLIGRDVATNDQLARGVEQVWLTSPVSNELFVRVARVRAEIPENDLNVTVSPPTPTVLEALRESIPWEARYVALLSPDAAVAEGWLDDLIAVAEADPAIAAVGPASNAAPAPQRVPPRVRGRRGGWEEVPYLGGFCLLLKSEAVQQVGGVDEDLPLSQALWDLYVRLRAQGFKLACAWGTYVQHADLTEDEGAQYDEWAAAETAVQTLLTAGQAALEVGDFETAVREFECVTRKYPDLVAGHVALGATLMALEQFAEAATVLRRAVELFPQEAALHNQLGEVLCRLEDYAAATEAFLSALKAAPTDVDARLGLAKVYQAQDRIAAAVDCLDQALIFTPDDVATLREYAQLNLKLGNAEAAQRATQRIEAIAPDDLEAMESDTTASRLRTPSGDVGFQPDGLVDLEAMVQELLAPGQAAVECGDLETAADEFTRLTRDVPDLAAGHAALGSTLLALGQTEQALPALRRAAELAPQEAALHNQLGIALYQNGESEAAEQIFQDTLQAAPANVDALLNLIELCRAEQRYAEATEYVKQALHVASDDVDVLTALGTLGLELGDVEAAQLALAHIRAIDPQHPAAPTLAAALAT